MISDDDTSRALNQMCMRIKMFNEYENFASRMRHTRLELLSNNWSNAC